jgi:hypothetical protein
MASGYFLCRRASSPEEEGRPVLSGADEGSEKSRKVVMASALLSLVFFPWQKQGLPWKRVCPPLDKWAGMNETMISFRAVSGDNGSCGHGLSFASLLLKGKLS